MTATQPHGAGPRAADAARPGPRPQTPPPTPLRRGGTALRPWPRARAAGVLLVVAPALLLALAIPACAPGTGDPHGEEAGAGHHDEGGHAGDEHGDEHGGDEHHEGEASVVELTPEAEARIGLAVEAAALRPLDARRETTGTLGYDEDLLAHVGSRVGGRLVRVDAELGEDVAAGATLAVVDSIEVGEAKAAYLRARARWEVAEQRHERQRSLHADEIVSEDVLLEAEGEQREAASDLAAARETLHLLGVSDDQVARLKWGGSEASRVPVRAPFAGRVVTRDATRGELVTPEDRLFTVADLSRVWLWVDLYERDLAHVRRGEAVEVEIDAYPGESFAGELAYVADEVDPHSRTARARVDLANPERRLKPGMFARVAIRGLRESGRDARLSVPRGAVQRHDAGPVVFVRTAPGRYERRAVEVGVLTAARAEIVAGLAAGDEVVTEGAFLLHSQASADQLGGHHH